jgi:carbonic anhydrase
VHGWIYRLGDGRLRHLDVSVHSEKEVEGLRERAVDNILATRKRHYAGR